MIVPRNVTDAIGSAQSGLKNLSEGVEATLGRIGRPGDFKQEKAIAAKSRIEEAAETVRLPLPDDAKLIERILSVVSKP